VKNTVYVPIYFAASYNFFTPTSGEVCLALNDEEERVVWHSAGCSRIDTKDCIIREFESRLK